MPSPPQHPPDWNLLWQQARKDKSWHSKSESDWDSRAAAFAGRTGGSTYAQAFLTLLRPEPDWSILDVGSGPGTLALPLAHRVRRVTCLDFSANMLAILQARAATQQLANIRTCKGSWTDDWRGLGLDRHDVVIASRSLAVTDLAAALRRLTEFARRMVAVTDKVHHGPFDPDAFAAVGRPLNSGPDYLYTVNLLHQMGQLATVDFIRLEEVKSYPSLDQALTRYTWMFPDLNPTETEALRHYLRAIATVRADGTITLQCRHVPTWAYISWRPEP